MLTHFKREQIRRLRLGPRSYRSRMRSLGPRVFRHRSASCRMLLEVLRIFGDHERIRYRVFDRERYRIRLSHCGGNHHR